MDFLRSFRNSLLILISGAMMGGYVAYGYEAKKLDHLETLVFSRGYCGDWDVDHNRHVYACRDSAVAMDLQARAIQADQELAEPDPIANLIRASEKKGKRK